MNAGRRRQTRRWDQLEQTFGPQQEPDRAARAYQLRHQRFPRERSATMPTRLGNVFRAAESYPADSRLYGMDAVFFWPRLYPLLPESLRVELASARSSIDMMLVTSVLSAALSLGVAADGAAAQLPVGGDDAERQSRGQHEDAAGQQAGRDPGQRWQRRGHTDAHGHLVGAVGVHRGHRPVAAAVRPGQGLGARPGGVGGPDAGPGGHGGRGAAGVPRVDRVVVGDAAATKPSSSSAATTSVTAN